MKCQSARIAFVWCVWLAWCGRRDSNPGSLAWKASVLTRLDDDRIVFVHKVNEVS